MAEDKRKNNGGHSTKAKGGKIDKRVNQYKQAINKAVTVEDVEKALIALKSEAFTGDIQAIKLLLEYTIGKPVTQIEAEIDANVEGGLDLKQLILDVFDKN